MLSAIWADDDRTDYCWVFKASVGAEKLDKSCVQYLQVLKMKKRKKIFKKSNIEETG